MLQTLRQVATLYAYAYAEDGRDTHAPVLDEKGGCCIRAAVYSDSAGGYTLKRLVSVPA